MGFDEETSRNMFINVAPIMLMERVGEPEDIAHLTSFLLSDDARNITGKFKCLQI